MVHIKAKHNPDAKWDKEKEEAKFKVGELQGKYPNEVASGRYHATSEMRKHLQPSSSYSPVPTPLVVNLPQEPRPPLVLTAEVPETPRVQASTSWQEIGEPLVASQDGVIQMTTAMDVLRTGMQFPPGSWTRWQLPPAPQYVPPVDPEEEADNVIEEVKESWRWFQSEGYNPYEYYDVIN